MSSDLWSLLDLSQPPNFTLQVNFGNSGKDLKVLLEVCRDAVNILKNQEGLHVEAATLSRLIYRMKTVFRNDKGLKCMEKINRCLRNYLYINPLLVYQNFLSSIPKNWTKDEIYCPTQQMLEYVLVRTQGLSALLCRIVHTCQQAAIFIQGRIALGHNWPIAVTSLCVISRIWAICQHLLESGTKWYSALLPFRDVLISKGAAWLPVGYMFPTDLTTWLSIPWIEMPDSLQQKNQVKRDFKSGLETPQSTPGKCELSSHSQFNSEDIGKVVFRTRKTVPQNNPISFSHKMAIKSSLKNVVLKQHKELQTEGKKIPRSSINLLESSPSVFEERDEMVASSTVLQSTDSDSRSLKKQKKKEKIKSKLSTLPNSANNTNESSSTKATGGSPSSDNHPRSEENAVSKETVSGGLPSSGLIIQQAHKKHKTPAGCKSSVELSAPNSEFISQAIASLKTEKNIRHFLNREKCNRQLTFALGDNQWYILHSWLEKQCAKLKKTTAFEKKAHLIDKIKTVLKTTLAQ